MLRVVLYVSLLATLFVGTVLGAGNAIGAWGPPAVPASPTSTAPAEKGKKAHGHHKAKRSHSKKNDR